MKVFKFGGASVKDAKGVRNLVEIVKDNGLQNTLIVVSAMGKMTNAFEEVVAQYMIAPKKHPKSYWILPPTILKLSSSSLSHKPK